MKLRLSGFQKIHSPRIGLTCYGQFAFRFYLPGRLGYGLTWALEEPILPAASPDLHRGI